MSEFPLKFDPQTRHHIEQRRQAIHDRRVAQAHVIIDAAVDLTHSVFDRLRHPLVPHATGDAAMHDVVAVQPVLPNNPTIAA